jgi:hypothetical protein
MSRVLVLFLAVFAAFAPVAMSQGKGEQTRSVQGAVASPDDAAVSGAVVFLKNMKSLQIRSFITKADGTYYFHGLSPDVDYELRAESNGLSSSPKTLSSFDSRKEAVLNLKLNKK